MLLFAETVLTERAVITPAWVGLCLTAIAMVGSHQPTAVMAAIFVALYLAARSVLLGWRASRLLPLALAGLVVTVGSTYFVVPFLAEKSWTGEDFASAIIAPHAPTWRELHNFVAWGATGTGSDASSYLGLSVLAVILAGAAASLRPGPRPTGARMLLGMFAALAVGTLVLEGSYVRQALFTTFFVCAAGAAAAQVLTEAFPARAALPLGLLLAFLLDVGPTAVQPWTRPDMRSLERAGYALAARAAGQRVLEAVYTPTGFSVSVGPDSSPLHYARVQMLYGVHKMEATKAHNAMVAVLKLAEDDLNDSGTLRPDTVGLLSLYNVGWLVGRERDRMGLPASIAGAVADDAIGAHLRIPTATPVLASGRLAATPEPAAFIGPPYGQARLRGAVGTGHGCRTGSPGCLSHDGRRLGRSAGRCHPRPLSPDDRRLAGQ
jgi:hypothetical protein